LRILDRYLIKEVVHALLGVAPVVLLIFLSDRFVRYLADAAAGKIPSDLILTLITLKFLSVLVILLPLTFYIAVMLALGRLYKDSEMTVLAAVGAGPARILSTILSLSVAVALLVSALSLYVSPWAIGKINELKARAQAASEITGLTPGRFKESRSGDRVIYVEHIAPDRRGMNNVFIQNREQGKLSIVSAERGLQRVDQESGDQFIVLESGQRYEGTPGSADYKVVHYARYSVRINEAEPVEVRRQQEAQDSRSLLASTERGAAAELQWRLSMPLSVILLAALAVQLARTTPRQGKYAKVALAILSYLIYNNMLGISRAWLERDLIPPWAGLWWVHGVLLLILVMLALPEIMPRKFLHLRRFIRRETG
jgi:lipopolysaccharide export system permease protein